MAEKALLVPFNSKQEIFLQDRRGHKPPPWGFFGGGIDEGETPLEAVIREAKEELDIDLDPEELIPIGGYDATFGEKTVHRHMFLWRTDQEEFTVLEGAGGHWMDHDTVCKYLVVNEKFDEIWGRILEITK